MNVFDLWIPILVAGVLVHTASTLAWTVLPHHKPDWKKLPVEDDFQDWLDSRNVPAEQYLFPMAKTPAEMNTEEYQAKDQKCRGYLVLWPKPVSMGAAIGCTFTFYLVVTFIIGYLASNARPAGDSFSNVFQFVTTAGLLAHCAAIFPHVFWFKQKYAMRLVDGIVYALITGVIFAWLWPTV